MGLAPVLCLAGLLQHLRVQSLDQKNHRFPSAAFLKQEDLLLLNSPPALQCATSNVWHFISRKVKRSRASLMCCRRGYVNTIVGLKPGGTTVLSHCLWNPSKRPLSIFMNIFSVTTLSHVEPRLKITLLLPSEKAPPTAPLCFDKANVVKPRKNGRYLQM